MVLFLESTYYVPDLLRALDEACRVLHDPGTLLVVSANPERPDFVASPYCTRYLTAAEFRESLERRGCTIEVEASHPVDEMGLRAPLVFWLRRAARRFLLIPSTRLGRSMIKRLVYGRGATLPEQVRAGPDLAVERQPVRRSETVPGQKVIYIKATRTHGADGPRGE